MTLEYTLKFKKAYVGIHPIEREKVREETRPVGDITYLVTETITDITSELLEQAKANAEEFVAKFLPESYTIQLNL